jgi:methionine-S-sulfoxide reductase
MQFNSFADEGLKKAIFAGGCFWCMEADFDKIPGVKDVISGYIGGTGRNPTYEDYGKKGHIEAVQISYDTSLITYANLLDLFWLRIDPTDAGGQFCDRGHEYSTAVFYATDEEKQSAEKSKADLEKSGKLKQAVATKIIEAGDFYPAEDHHQDYHKKNPIKYKFYRFNCGRDRRLKEIWGDVLKPGKGERKDMVNIKNYSRNKGYC